MMKNNLFTVFATLSKPEIKRFMEYVSYPLYNKHAIVGELVEFLSRRISKYPAEGGDDLRQKVRRHFFPKDPHGKAQTRRLLSKTYALLADFLMQEELNVSEKEKEILLRRVFIKRRLSNLYLASLEKERQQLAELQERDFKFYWNRMRIARDFYYYPGTSKYEQNEPMKALVSIHGDLDTGYLLAKLHYACQVKVLERFTNQKPSVHFLDETLAMAKSGVYANQRLVQLYVQMLDVLEATSKEAYLALKTELLSCMDLLSKELRPHLFVLLLNLTWLSLQRREVPQAMFDLYQHGLKNNLLLLNGFIGSGHFNNIVDLGCSLGAFEETRQFVNDYFPYLEVGGDLADNIKNLYKAFLYFGEGNYENASQHLQWVEFKDFSFGLRAYSLLLKCTYELKQGTKDIQKLADAFKQYIYRKHKQGLINDSIRKENLNFIYIIVRLPEASNSKFALVSTEALGSKLAKMKRVVSRSWLAAKIREIDEGQSHSRHTDSKPGASGIE